MGSAYFRVAEAELDKSLGETYAPDQASVPKGGWFWGCRNFESMMCKTQYGQQTMRDMQEEKAKALKAQGELK